MRGSSRLATLARRVVGPSPGSLRSVGRFAATPHARDGRWNVNIDETRSKVGAIVANLQSLEFALRLVLAASEPHAGVKLDLDRLRVGNRVPESPLTNYDTLGQVIEKVNRCFVARGVADKVDASVVEIRDALAHGRVFALRPDGPYRLVKFAKPVNGAVEVASVAELTAARLDHEIERTGSELRKVVRVARSLGLACFPED